MDYDRLAKFAEARRRLVEAQKRRTTLTTFEMQRAVMETLFEQFDRSVADALRIRMDLIRTELELGFTFLDSAKAKGLPGSQGGVRNAITALRTANWLLRMQPRLNDAAVYRRRDELRQRLRDTLTDQRL